MLDRFGAAYGWTLQDIERLPLGYAYRLYLMATERLNSDPVRAIIKALMGGG